MVKCNMCGKVFKTEEDIPLIIEWEDGSAEVLNKNSWRKPGGEAFRGCPYCKTDAYLMDMEGSDDEG